MKILIVGSGISGMSAAIEAAGAGAEVTLISANSSERSQSVMAAGGINAVLYPEREGDSIESHIQDTYKGGGFIENIEDIRNLCESAPKHLKFLEELGVVFNREKDGKISQRAFGGQSYKRTAFSGASTGKQIVTALVRKCREYECKGKINRITGLIFYSALIKDGRCYGLIMMNAFTGKVFTFIADKVIIATGGQNKIFGKTTGTENCDGYVAGKLFTQGVTLKNLEFIQYHPTTIETPHKRMLITEGARGEGGRLYCIKDGKRSYFMEEKFGEKGNLMPRDVVSKCEYDCDSQVYLDISFLGKKRILERLSEVYDVCEEYINLDVTKESIPVAPAVHFFMGGIAVDSKHETNIKNLYAVGECASMYHGANRLGGNSLMAAVHSGRVAAWAATSEGTQDFENNTEIKTEQWIKDEENMAYEKLRSLKGSKSKYPAVFVLKEIANIMNSDLGITRSREDLENGLKSIDFYKEVLEVISFDPDVSVYENLRLYYMTVLSEAIILSALERKESRGSHIREDYPDTLEEYQKCSYANYRDGEIEITYR